MPNIMKFLHLFFKEPSIYPGLQDFLHRHAGEGGIGKALREGEVALHHPAEQARLSCDQETAGGGAQLAFFLNTDNDSTTDCDITLSPDIPYFFTSSLQGLLISR